MAAADKRDTTVKVTVTAKEKANFEDLARRRGLSLSSWLRFLASSAWINDRLQPAPAPDLDIGIHDIPY